MIEFIENPATKSSICDNILHSLPAWFGIEKSIQEYIEGCAALPFWAYKDERGNYGGFIAIKPHSPFSAEIYVTGVKENLHRGGIGKQLFTAAYNYCRDNGYEFLQVKTVDAGLYPEYDKTRMFYEKMGFKKLEVLPTLWDEYNPCLVMIMSIK